MNHSEFTDVLGQYGNHFSVSEFSISGDQTKMKRDIVEPVAALRLWHGFPTYISSAFRPGDPRSHGQGLAIDQIMFYDWENVPVAPLHQWNLANGWGFKGVGIYFDWRYKGKLVPGLHLDNLDDGTRPARWLRITQNGQRLYFYMNWKTGKFYNKDQDKILTLAEAIKLYHNGKSDT